MQYKTLAALLFASAAVAAPAAETTSSASLDDYDSYDDYPEYAGISIPTSVYEILETAVAPTAWANSMISDTAFVNAEASRIANDQYPAWISSLPDSAQTYVEQELKAEASMYLYEYTVSGSSFPASTTAASSTETSSSSSGSSAAITKTGSESATETATDSSSKAATTSSTASGSQSGSSTSTSTGGAPAATGGIAMSLAGAAGVLGLALAL
ncbi:hypothetical protein PENSTE_c027G07884 [Penicillium steckii]|uniref:Uncharacterized protein n=1 Tax=Penicillium steckii TaxID=303698 RepID=A0A1V6SQ67_9EURO|nr:hypothetical protein PENSTE_c027G07884 [Penicillium steckii]